MDVEISGSFKGYIAWSLSGGFVHGNLGGLRPPQQAIVYLVKSFLPTLLRMIQHSFLFGLI